VCLTTKAVHLEIVSSLSADEFVATLKRFVSRRGYPSDIYSDSDSNFAGALTPSFITFTSYCYQLIFKNQLLLTVLFL